MLSRETKVLATVNVKVNVVWDVAPFGLVDRQRNFRKYWYLHLQDRKVSFMILLT